MTHDVEKYLTKSANRMFDVKQLKCLTKTVLTQAKVMLYPNVAQTFASILMTVQKVNEITEIKKSTTMTIPAGFGGWQQRLH